MPLAPSLLFNIMKMRIGKAEILIRVVSGIESIEAQNRHCLSRKSTPVVAVQLMILCFHVADLTVQQASCSAGARYYH